MRVYFDNIMFSLQEIGGGTTVWKELLKRFIQSRDLRYHCIEYPKAKDNSGRIELDIPEKNIINKTPFFPKLERYYDIRINEKEPFIFHSSYYRICNSKYAINITTVHDFMYELYEKRRVPLLIHKWQKYRAIRKADAVVCISNNTKQDVLRYVKGVNPEKIRVIYNGVSSDYYPLGNECKIDEKSLLYVGGRRQYKNFMPLVQALSGTKYQLIICGSPLSEDEQKHLDTYMQGRYNVVKFPSNRELNQYYNTVKCLLYPSEYEGFGIPIVEAQRAGCPVIAYNASCIPEVLNDDRMLLDSLTRSDIERLLNKLDDQNFRADVIARGIENAKRFNWDIIAKQYIELYKELINIKK